MNTDPTAETRNIIPDDVEGHGRFTARIASEVSGEVVSHGPRNRYTADDVRRNHKLTCVT